MAMTVFVIVRQQIVFTVHCCFGCENNALHCNNIRPALNHTRIIWLTCQRNEFLHSISASTLMLVSFAYLNSRITACLLQAVLADVQTVHKYYINHTLLWQTQPGFELQTNNSGANTLIIPYVLECTVCVCVNIRECQSQSLMYCRASIWKQRKGNINKTKRVIR